MLKKLNTFWPALIPTSENVGLLNRERRSAHIFAPTYKQFVVIFELTFKMTKSMLNACIKVSVRNLPLFSAFLVWSYPVM